MKFKMIVTSTAMFMLSSLSINANATFCAPQAGGVGGCDGTGVNFKAIQSARSSGPADTITMKDINIGKQLDLKMSSATISGNSVVLFTFRNVGLIDSSIVDVFFDDVDNNPLFKIGSKLSTPNTGVKLYQNGWGTGFAMDSVTEALPAANGNATYGFVANYSADTMIGRFDAGEYIRGVDDSSSSSSIFEYVTFVGYLNGSNNLNNVVDAINDGSFQVGLNVATYNTTTLKYDFNAYLSENCPPPAAVPVPAAAWLFGSALIGFVTISNRRRV